MIENIMGKLESETLTKLSLTLLSLLLLLKQCLIKVLTLNTNIIL